MTDRLIEPTQINEDVDTALRPKTLDSFVGQKKIRENLSVFVEAARQRGDA
ncbi:Holliday junction branch migration DNA helicase RuvB, partial [Alphaproteobacteria bacterium]|nr:Holliday junction branch migration DNA helicase RuvB [Alphaproteobacteria bacterium]